MLAQVANGQTRPSENARITRIRSDYRAPQSQCWRVFPGNARITRLFEKTFSRDCHTGPTGTPGRHQKFSKKSVRPCVFPQSHAQHAFPANANPCAAVRCRATGEDFPTEHHFAPAIPALQQGPGRATRMKPGHRLAAPALPCPSTVSGSNLSKWKKKSKYGHKKYAALYRLQHNI